MAQKYFAMDFAFYSTMGVYSFRDCCEITRAVGYDAMLLSIWDGRNWAQATEMETMKSRYGVEPAGVYVVLNLAVGEEDPRNAGIVTMLETMPEGSKVQLAIQTAAPNRSALPSACARRDRAPRPRHRVLRLPLVCRRECWATSWDEGGDACNKLERSLHALKSMRKRAEEHPHWAGHIDA